MFISTQNHILKEISITKTTNYKLMAITIFGVFNYLSDSRVKTVF
jgi:hypothetical protein